MSSFNFFPLADTNAAVPSGLSNGGGDSPILGVRTLLFPPPATGLFLCAYAPAFPADNGTMRYKEEVKVLLHGCLQQFLTTHDLTTCKPLQSDGKPAFCKPNFGTLANRVGGNKNALHGDQRRQIESTNKRTCISFVLKVWAVTHFETGRPGDFFLHMLQKICKIPLTEALFLRYNSVPSKSKQHSLCTLSKF